MLKRKIIRRLAWSLASLFIIMNIMAAFQAYHFTHFSHADIPKTEAAKMPFGEKLKTLLFGINNPRPKNDSYPVGPYQTIFIQSNVKIECWLQKLPNAKGTVILFHGYRGTKASLLDKAQAFMQMGYNTLLVDFMGSGGSEGDQTTVGFKEAQQVRSCYDYMRNLREKNIVLFGTSMGAVAVMKAVHDATLKPNAVIIECPFGTMYKTTCARFHEMHLPCFPMAGLLVFWGGLENGFWGFGHNPEAYAMDMYCPVLLLYGEKDNKVSREEINTIYGNLPGQKELRIYPLAGHENYLNKYAEKWKVDISGFLKKYDP